MKYVTTITPTGSPVGTGRTYEIEVEEGGLVRVDGKEYVADLQRIADLDLYSLLLDNQSYEVHVEDMDRNNYRVMVSAQGYEGYEVRVVDERTYRVVKSSGGLVGASTEGAIKAPIPGLVVRILVAEGDEVKMGQTVVILQAMKMENELRAQRAGTVATIKCTAGDSVNQGDTLVTLN